MDALKPYLAMLNEEQIAELSELPRHVRMGKLAEFIDEREEDLLKQMARQLRLSILDEIKLSEDKSDNLPLRLIYEYQCLPVQLPDITGSAENNTDQNRLRLVTAWPPDAEMDKWIFACCGKKPTWYLGAADKVNETISEIFGVGAQSLDDSDLEGFADVQTDAADEEDEDAALIRFVNEIITKAVADRATDIHFEPQKDELQIRYRIDGQLVPVRVRDNLVHFQKAIISRLKIMAKLNISERRRPQDGRISFTLGKEDFDIRISSLPTMYGESVSLRLLSNKTQPVTIRELGFLPSDEAAIDANLERPHGIVLATGPTGAGKSTTLSAFIRRIRSPERRIITVEDPVEYEIAGINQTQVHHDIGLTFASSLRSILRQDPDVIMVGEIRDPETAEIAIRASLTGHLVLSTLHTNDSPGALTRLIDMQIEPFLIASSVEMVIAQRLVRRLCEHCSEYQYVDTAYLRSCLSALHVDPAQTVHADKIKRPKGCEHCRGFGFRGRVGLFEILNNNEDIHELIIRRASAREIRIVAESQGMRTLQSCGWEQVKRGMTSLSEVMRYADMVASTSDDPAADI